MSDDKDTAPSIDPEEARKSRRREISHRYREKHRDRVNDQQNARNAANREAVRERDRRLYAEDPEKMRAKHRRYYEANKEKISQKIRSRSPEQKAANAARQRELYRANIEKEKARDKVYSAKYALKRRVNRICKNYGLTKEQYSEMLSRTEGKCPCCRTAFSTAPGNKASVDHCHRTGMVRGIICGQCNLLLGHAADSAKILRLAARYLDRFAKGRETTLARESL